jgi:multiple sugar transport system substrate-binding protein
MFYTDIQPVLDGKKTAAQFVKEEQPKMQSKLDAANQQKKTAEATAGK